MKKIELYVYLGDSGTITTSMYIPGATGIKKYQLIADKDRMLTNGENFVKSVIIPERELPNWKEVPTDGQE